MIVSGTVVALGNTRSGDLKSIGHRVSFTVIRLWTYVVEEVQ